MKPDVPTMPIVARFLPGCPIRYRTTSQYATLIAALFAEGIGNMGCVVEHLSFHPDWPAEDKAEAILSSISEIKPAAVDIVAGEDILALVAREVKVPIFSAQFTDDFSFTCYYRVKTDGKGGIIKTEVSRIQASTTGDACDLIQN